MNKTFSLSAEQMQKLDSIQPLLYSLVNSLSGVVQERHIEGLQKASDLLSSALSEYNAMQEQEANDAYDYFSKIERENNFMTSWSYGHINIHDLFSTVEEDIVVEYKSGSERQEVIVSGSKTWLNMWYAADQLVRLSGDKHHIFIENFEQITPTHYRLQTGS